MAGYIRQSTYTDGDVIQASDSNAEFDQMLAALNNSTGHKHDGTTAEGPVIALIGDGGVTVPLNKIAVDSTNDRLSFYVDVAAAGVEQLRIEDGVVYPATNNDINLGTAVLMFKDGYFAGLLESVNLQVTNIKANDGTASGSIADSTGIFTIASAVLTTVDINGGTVDATIIGGTTAAAGTFTTLNSTTLDTTNIEVTNIKAKDGTTAGSIADSTGVVTLASSVLTTTDINGGTLDGVTIGGVTAGVGTFTSLNATTLDMTNIEVTNVKAKDGTASATIADTTGIMTIASSVLTTADINGGTADSITIGDAVAAAGTFTTLTATGSIVVTGTVDGRDVAADGTKLDTLETGATADQTASQIKAAYEGEANAFTDAQFTKLSNIETGATADQTGAQIKAAYEGETSAFTDALFTKLSNIETSATSDQSGSQIKTSYESQANTNAFTDSDLSKLSGVEASADVTDTANVTSAGALMDSEVSGNLKTLTLPANTTISSFGKTLVDDANAAAALVTLGVSSTAAELNQLDGNVLTSNTSVTTSGDTTLTVKSTGTGDADATLVLDAADTGEPEVSFKIDGVAKASVGWFDAGPDLNITTFVSGNIDFQPNSQLAMRVAADGDVKIYGGNTTTDTRTFSVESEGYSVVRVRGDLSNTSGEPGGAGLAFGVDGSVGNALVSYVNTDGEDGIGGSYDGMQDNSMLVGTISNSALFFGVDSKVYTKLDSTAFSVGGLLDDTFPANNTSGNGISLRYSGRVVAVSDNNTSLSIGRHSGVGDVAEWYYSGSVVGTVSVTSSATAYNTSSDYRLKENITPIQGASDIVKAMNPCTYTAIVDGIWYDGFLAHELQDVLPRAVTGTKDGMKDEEYEVTPATEAEEAIIGTRSVPDMQSVDYAKLTPILVASLQEVLGRIDALEAAIDRMK